MLSTPVTKALAQVTMPFYTYILKSEKDGGYYFGHTSDLEGRLKVHNQKKVPSTKGRVPFILHYFEEFETKSQAYRREQFFKTFEGRLYLKANNII